MVRREEQRENGNCREISLYSILKERRRGRVLRKGYGVKIWRKGEEK